MKLNWPAPERNKDPILEVLRRVLPKDGTVLEIASGTGQHVVHFAKALPGLHFFPTDVDEANLASIAEHVADAKLPNIAPPVRLDVLESKWPVEKADAVFSANMIHISPSACTGGLLRGASRVLSPSGLLVLYGPFMVDGVHTSESNEVFDAELRRRDPDWGVRDLAVVAELAAKVGLSLEARVPMPANNFTVVFRRADQAALP